MALILIPAHIGFVSADPDPGCGVGENAIASDLRVGGAARQPAARDPRRALQRRCIMICRRTADRRSNTRSVPALVTALARLGCVGPEPTMERTVTMLVAYTVALDLIRSLRPVVEQLRTYSVDSADQVVRAGTSITHNIAEGSRRSGKDPKRFYRMAHGSAAEILAALDTADAWGWRVDTAESRRLVDRQLRLLYGLCR